MNIDGSTEELHKVEEKLFSKQKKAENKQSTEVGEAYTSPEATIVPRTKSQTNSY